MVAFSCAPTKSSVDKAEQINSKSTEALDVASDSVGSNIASSSKEDIFSTISSWFSEKTSKRDSEVVSENITTTTDSAGNELKSEQRLILRDSQFSEESYLRQHVSSLRHSVDSLSSELALLKSSMLSLSDSTHDSAYSEHLEKERSVPKFFIWALLFVDLLFVAYVIRVFISDRKD